MACILFFYCFLLLICSRTWRNIGKKKKKKEGNNFFWGRLSPVLSLKELRQQLQNKLRRYKLGLTTLFVAVVGICSAVVGLVIELTVSGLWNGLFHWTKNTYPWTVKFSMLQWISNTFAQFLLWIIFLILTLAIGVFATIRFAPTASGKMWPILCFYVLLGSGIPEMKTILSGSGLTQFLSVKTLIIKVFGLIFSVGSGL